MRVLITGATGLLGRPLMAAFADYEVLGTGFSRAEPPITRLDLTDFPATRDCVAAFKPQVIIHSAAERRPDISEKDPEGTQRLNVDATRALAEAAQNVGAWMLYLSTDYVFDGTTPPYAPNHVPNPLNDYGRSKLEGEQVLHSVMPDGGVLRVPILYGQLQSLDESAITKLVPDIRNSAPRKIDHWAVRCPTLTDDVAQVIHTLVGKRMADPRLGGTWHFGGPEKLTKYDMSLIMAEILGIDASHLEPDSNPPPGAPRPRDCWMDCSALDTLCAPTRTPFRPAMTQVLKPWA